MALSPLNNHAVRFIISTSISDVSASGAASLALPQALPLPLPLVRQSELLAAAWTSIAGWPWVTWATVSAWCIALVLLPSSGPLLLHVGSGDRRMEGER